MSQNYNITTLMKRLEAATSRLEDLVEYSSKEKVDAPTVSSAGTASAPAENANPSPTSSAEIEGDSTKVASLESLLPLFEELKSKAASIDPVVEKQTSAFVEAVKASFDIVRTSEKSLKPELYSPEFVELFAPLSKAASEVVELRESNRSSKFVNLLSTLSEGAPALGWLSVDEKPADFIQEFIDSSQFYANRALRDGGASADWAKGFLASLRELKKVVGTEFPTGLSWNSHGKPLKEILSTTKPATGGPPPPPPPPPLPAVDTSSSKEAAPSGMSAVFSDLKQGTSITQGLKKTSSKAPKPAPPPKPASLKNNKASTPSDTKKQAPTSVKTPSKTLVESRWIVENYIDTHDIVIDAEMNQSVLIDNCSNSTIQIKGKANSVSVNKCRKSGVLVENLVSSVSLVKCEDFGLQVTGTLPSLTVDQSHSCNIYLSKKALEVDIYTSQTSTININLPTDEEGDYKEVPLPEQIVHKVKPNGLGVDSRSVGAHEH